MTKTALLFAALLIAAFVGAGPVAADDGPYPPVPSDADLTTMVNKAVADMCSFVDDPVHDVCTEINITKMHLESFPGDSARMNRIVVDFKKTTGPYSNDPKYTTLYVLIWAGIGEAPPPYEFTSETSGKTRQAAWDEFKSRFTQWLPGWDLRPVEGHGETPAPDLPLCNAIISVTPNLVAGDTLSPDAAVTSVDGAPVQGTISMIWSINGVVANSVTWDGNPAAIVLQLSCQGHAQEFQATYNGSVTQGPGPAPGESAAPEPSGLPEESGVPEPQESGAPEPQESGAPVPTGAPPVAAHGRATRGGLGGIGTVPGPADPTQGLVGMVVPGLLGVLGGLLLAGGGSSAPTTPGGTAPGGPAPTGSGPRREGPKPGEPGATDFSDPNSSTDAALQAAGDTWLGRKISAGGAAVVSFATSAGRGISQIKDALTHPTYFFKGLEAATQNVAPAESAAMDSALADGSYLDALGAGIMKYGKGYLAGYQAVGGVGVSMVTGMLPVDEVKTFLDPKASWADRFAAYQSAEVKVGLLLLPGLGEVRGAGVAVDAARAAEAANAAAKAGRAVEAAATAATAAKAGRAVEAAATASTAAKATDAVDAAVAGRTAKATAAEATAAEATAGVVGPAKPPPLTPERLEATIKAGKSVERLAATVLGDAAAPTSLREGARLLRLPENRGLQEVVDNVNRADAGSGAARMGRQVGDLSDNAHNLITAGKMDRQNEAMNSAATIIAQREAAACQAAGEAVPRRIPTFQVTQGNRGYISGANANTDLDMTFQVSHVSSAEANEILAGECKKLGFSQDALGTHAYVAKPGTLVDVAGDAPLSDSFVRGNLQQINSKSGYVPTYTAPNGAVTVGSHVDAGLGTEALPLPQRFGPTGAPASENAATAAARAAASSADIATQIGKIDTAVAADNVNDCAKAAARAIKAGGHFVGPEDAVMRAAAAKDPVAATRILHQAGIDSLADLRARVQP